MKSSLSESIFTRHRAANSVQQWFLLDSGDDDFVAAPITSRPRVSDFDVPIHQWREAGLNTASTMRVHKLTVLAKDGIVRRLGEIAELDRTLLTNVLRRAFSLDQ